MKTTKQLPGGLPPGCDLDSPLTIEQAAVWMQMTVEKVTACIHARLISAVMFDRKNIRVIPRHCLEFWKKNR